MIFIKNRRFVFSEEEDEIFAFDGDNNVKTVVLCLPTVDFKDYTFRLDLEKENGDKGIVYLTKRVQEDRILLFWKPQNSSLAPGNLRAQLRAFLADGDEVWHSEQAVFYVGESINASAAYPEVLPSEFTEMEQRIAALDEHVSSMAEENRGIYEDSLGLHEKMKVLHSQTAADNASAINANRQAGEYFRKTLESEKQAREWAQKSAESAQDSSDCLDEARKMLEQMEQASNVVSPTVEIVPMENSNAYRMIKKAYRMSTIRWCDEADGDIERTLSFTAKVEYTVPYVWHAWYVQVRKRDGKDATLLQLGSDGAGNTIVYCQEKKVAQLTDGWHDYVVSWNHETGALSIMADGIKVFDGEYVDLIMSDAHGIQITAAWQQTENPDIISFDTFSLMGDGVLRYLDNFNDAPIGKDLPDFWYQNDSETQNIREVFLNTDQEVYLSITDENGTKRTGNIKGKDAELREGSVTGETLADGCVGMEKLSSDVRVLLEKIQVLVANEENTDDGVG